MESFDKASRKNEATDILYGLKEPKEIAKYLPSTTILYD